MFRDDYAAELEYLHQLTGEVAEKHPREAPLLGRDASPAVSRLLQSAAFYFARLRQRLDDDLPEVIHPVIESLFPSLLRPMPSATVVELRPAPGLKAPFVVPAGAPFASKAIEGGSCLFRSTVDVEVRPWRLDRVELTSERRELQLGVALAPGAKIDGLPPGSALRLFLAGPSAMALGARSALLRNSRDVVARSKGGSGVSLLGDGSVVAPARPLRVDEEDVAALAVLRAFFAWPAFFAFVDLPNIDRALPLAHETGRFDIVVRLAEPLPRSIRLDPDTVRIHCVPALNLQRLPNPVQSPLRGSRCTITLPREGMQVHSIGKVTLVRDDLTTREAVPFAAFFPPIVDPDGAPQILFSVERRSSVVGNDPVVSLTFQGADLARIASAKVELLTIDGARAERLGVGDVSMSVSGSPSLVTFENITPVSRALPPAFDRDRLWQWFQLLKIPLQELATREQLGACLALANAPAWAEWPDAKPSAERFEALVGVRTLRATTRDDALISIAVDVDPGGFAGLGDLDLFGETVQGVLASTLRPHEAVALSVCDAEGAALFGYPPVRGTREGL